MNLYFLVEGRRTESIIYPGWLHDYFKLKRLKYPGDARKGEDGYYLISAEGYPAILRQHLENSILDIEENNVFDYLVLVLDSEETSVEYRMQEIEEAIETCPVKLSQAEIRPIVQHRCMESWLLGNRNIYPARARNYDTMRYLHFYDTFREDPERSPRHPDFNTTAQFHYSYLKNLFIESHQAYSKKTPGLAATKSYFDSLMDRYHKTGHLQSLRPLIRLFKELDERLRRDK